MRPRKQVPIPSKQAEVIVKQQFNLNSSRGPTVAIPEILLLGNREGFSVSGQVVSISC